MALITQPLKKEAIALWKKKTPISEIPQKLPIPVGKSTVFRWIAQERQRIAQNKINSVAKQGVAS